MIVGYKLKSWGMHLSIESYVIVCGTFWFMIVAGLNVNFSDVYKPHGFKKRCALLREDVFDILIISAAPSLIPWTTEKVGYIGLFFPSLPIPDSNYFSTIDTTFSQQSSCKDPLRLWKRNRRVAAESLEVFYEDYIGIRNCLGPFYWNSQALFHKSKLQ